MGRRQEKEEPPEGKVEEIHESEKLTKRQRRKQLQKSDKNAWPQHPKVQSPAARAKAYIRAAGLVRKPDESVQESAQSPSMKWGRLLGGTDQRARHKAVLQLQAFLKAKCDINNEIGGLSEQDLMKLWKALWHTLYMADKVPVQEELSKQIAHLIWCVAGSEEEDEYAGQAYLDMYYSEEGVDLMVCGKLNPDDEETDEVDENDANKEVENGSNSEDEVAEVDSEHEEPSEDHDGNLEALDDAEIPHCRGAHLASLFVRTFFRTLRREWGKMDKYRIDKFYTLTRLMMHQVFRYMALRHWNLGIIRLFNDALFEEVLSQTPNGLRYHLTDLTLEELASVSAAAPMPLTEATFLDCLDPFIALAQTGGGDDVVQARVVEQILVRFLEQYSIVCPGAESDDTKNTVIMDQVHVGTIAKFIFELASDGGTSDEYRKSLYDVHKMYVRRLKQSNRDVDLGQDDEVDETGVDVEDGQVENRGFSSIVEEPTEQTKNSSIGRKSKATDTSVTTGETELLHEKKKRKKTKKLQKLEVTSSVVEEASEVTISVAEQMAAKKAMKSSATAMIGDEVGVKKRKVLQKSVVSESLASKRVKFDDANRAKSWKASMNDLRRMDSPGSTETPEKGILLNKHVKPKVKKVKRRKKAVDYF